MTRRDFVGPTATEATLDELPSAAQLNSVSSQSSLLLCSYPELGADIVVVILSTVIILVFRSHTKFKQALLT